MTANKEEIIIDTSGFKALIDNKDEFHKEAVKIWKKLEREEIIIVTSNYVLDETFTLFRAKCGIEIVLEFRDYIVKSTPILKIQRVTSRDEASAWNWFVKDWGKLSFTDCVSFGLMRRLNIKRVVSFDDHFKQAGFSIERI